MIMKSNMTDILLDEDPLKVPASRLGRKLGEAGYFLASGRNLEDDAGSLKSGFSYATTALAEPMGITKVGYKFWTGRELEDDLNSGLEYVKKLPQNIGTYLLGSLGSWIFGSGETQIDENLAELTRKVLSDEIDFETHSQERLHEISKGKFSGKKIYGFYDKGKIFLDEETAADEGPKYRALLHEAFESVSVRPDNENDEQEHVDLELKVIGCLEYAAKNFTGELKAKAEKAKEAFYRTVYKGAEAGDDLMSKVKSFLN